MRFQVPQFIEIEDKIFGPLTVKQFIYVGGGIGMAAVLYRFLPFPLFINIVLSLPPVIVGAALAFYKVNNKPLIFVLQASIKYLFGPKLYIWKKLPPEMKAKEKAEDRELGGLYVPKLSDSKLKDLTWSLDINENLNPGSNETMKRG